jgi:hypothetical protein
LAQGRSLGPNAQVVEVAEAVARAAEGVVCQLDAALAEQLEVRRDLESGRLLVVADLTVGSELLQQAAHPAIAGLLLRNRPPSDTELVDALARVTRPIADATLGYIKPEAEVEVREIVDSTRRGEAIDAIDRFFQARGLEARFINQHLTIADELITNALYDAPTDAEGRRPYARLSRIEPLTAAPGRAVELRYGYDGSRVFVSVKDRYGSFDRWTLVRAIEHCLAEPRAAVTAGLGLPTAFRAATALIYAITPDSSCEALGLLDVDTDYRAFIHQGKAFDFYFKAA